MIYEQVTTGNGDAAGGDEARDFRSKCGHAEAGGRFREAQHQTFFHLSLNRGPTTHNSLPKSCRDPIRPGKARVPPARAWGVSRHCN